jgi:hypothetical protein
MSRNSTLLIVALFQFVFSFSQVQLPVNTIRYQDSLNVILSSKNTDHEKATANFLLCDSWYRKDTVKAKEYLDNAKLFSKTDSFLNAIYFYYKANLTSVNSIEQAEVYYMMGDSALRNFTDKSANI